MHMQELMSLVKKKPVEYFEFDETDLGQIPKIEGNVVARSIHAFRETENEIQIRQGIEVNSDYGLFEKEFYNEYSEMIEETYKNMGKLSEYDFEEQIETSAHEAFHILLRSAELNENYNIEKNPEMSELNEKEEGYAVLFGKTMKYLSLILESEQPETILSAYDEAFELAKAEIVYTKNALEEREITNDEVYRNYILPAYEIANSEQYGNLAPFAETFINSIRYNFPEKYRTQELNFFECAPRNYQSCCSK